MVANIVLNPVDIKIAEAQQKVAEAAVETTARLLHRPGQLKNSGVQIMFGENGQMVIREKAG